MGTETIDFGELEAALSLVHRISDRNRTKFQARLKNLHRVGWPVGFQSTKGKASEYGVGAIVDMALATELFELGLGPERTARVLSSGRFACLNAYRMAASWLLEKPWGFSRTEVSPHDPASMFLYFDPSGLDALTDDMPRSKTPDLDEASQTFFYAGIGIVKEMIDDWTSGWSSRISLVNISALLDLLAFALWGRDEESDDYLDQKKAFFQSIIEWSEGALDEWYGGDEAEEQYTFQFLATHRVGSAKELSEIVGIPIERADQYYRSFRDGD